jgi:hypothetical protein
MFKKGDSRGLMKKGTYENRLLGAVKYGKDTLSDPLVIGGITALQPEIGLGLALAKKGGLLKKK